MNAHLELSNQTAAPAALLFATLALLAAVGPTAQGGTQCLQSSDELPCELTIPDNTLWWDYFDSVGDNVEYDDECGMETPASQPLVQAGATWIGLEMPSTPHQIRYELLVKSARLSPYAPGEIVILDMVRSGDGRATPVVELRLTAATQGLELRVYTDAELVRLSGAEIDPAGARVAVELVKSRDAEARDGRVTLLVDDQPVLEATCLRLWENLPTDVRLGVVRIEASEDLGILEFQPLGFSHKFFASSP